MSIICPLSCKCKYDSRQKIPDQGDIYEFIKFKFKFCCNRIEFHLD